MGHKGVLKHILDVNTETGIKNKENRLIRSFPQATLEKEMATHSSILFFFFHSSILAWKMPWMEEPDGLGGLQSMGLQRVRHD